MAKYTDYIDYMRGNASYKGGKGSLLMQRLPYTENFLENVKTYMNKEFTPLKNEIWLDTRTGKNYEIKVWNGDIYILSI
jgi:hypothetical protein